MHSLWDTRMIERINRSEDFWVKELAAYETQNQDALAVARQGTIEDWATESPPGRARSLQGSRIG